MKNHIEVAYKKDLEKSYMLIKTEGINEGDYKIKMLCNNNISGINPLSVRKFNDSTYIYYDISNKISLTGRFGENKMKAKDIRMFMYSVQRMVEGAKQYMLDINKFLLDMDFIFAKTKGDILEFCYYPDKIEDFQTSLQCVFNKIIQLADHTDRETVIISYGLQKMSMEENVTINEMLAFLGKEQGEQEDSRADGSNCKSEHKRESLNDEEEHYTKTEYKKSSNQKEEKNIRKLVFNTKEKGNHSTGNSKKINIWEKIRTAIFYGRKTYENIEEMELSQNNQGNHNIYDIDRLVLGEEEPLVAEKENTYQAEINEGRKYSDIPMQKSTSRDTEETVLLRATPMNMGIILQCADIERAQTIIPNDYPCIIGKSKKSADCIIEDRTISRVHLRINEEEDGYYIEDLNSTNGTYLNDERLKPHQLEKIKIGDKIKLSEIEYVVC